MDVPGLKEEFADYLAVSLEKELSLGHLEEASLVGWCWTDDAASAFFL